LGVIIAVGVVSGLWLATWWRGGSLPADSGPRSVSLDDDWGEIVSQVGAGVPLEIRRASDGGTGGESVQVKIQSLPQLSAASVARLDEWILSKSIAKRRSRLEEYRADIGDSPTLREALQEIELLYSLERARAQRDAVLSGKYWVFPDGTSPPTLPGVSQRVLGWPTDSGEEGMVVIPLREDEVQELVELTRQREQVRHAHCSELMFRLNSLPDLERRQILERVQTLTSRSGSLTAEEQAFLDANMAEELRIDWRQHVVTWR